MIKNFSSALPDELANNKDVDDLLNAVGFKPNTSFEEDISKFTE